MVLPSIFSLERLSPKGSYHLVGQRYEWHTCSETSYRITDVECIGRAKTTVKPNRRNEKKNIYIGLRWPPAATYNCAQVHHRSPAGTFTRVPGRCLRWSPTPPGPRWPPAKLEVLHLFRWYTHTHPRAHSHSHAHAHAHAHPHTHPHSHSDSHPRPYSHSHSRHQSVIMAVVLGFKQARVGPISPPTLGWPFVILKGSYQVIIVLS